MINTPGLSQQGLWTGPRGGSQVAATQMLQAKGRGQGPYQDRDWALSSVGAVSSRGERSPWRKP